MPLSGFTLPHSLPAPFTTAAGQPPATSYQFQTPTLQTRAPHYDMRPRNTPFRYGHLAAYTVLIEAGVATPYPGTTAPTPERIRNADAYFGGGRNHTVTPAQKTILETAGYTVG